MALGTNPREKYKVILSKDKGADPEPCYWFRYLTGSEMKELAGMSEKSDQAGTAGDVITGIFDVIRFSLVGWDNIGIEYDPAKLEDAIYMVDAYELSNAILMQGRTATDLKK